MPRELTEVFSMADHVISSAVNHLSSMVPPPKLVETPTGAAYRYEEKLPQQGIILKCVRLLSANRSAYCLIQNGLYLDAGSSYRIADEVGTEIMFLSGPLIFGTAPEARHEQFLEELFQEEFDQSTALSSSQSRKRVPRDKIISYVSRAYGAKNVSEAVEVFRTIDKTYSGFIHGAGVHTLDVYDGATFSVQLMPTDAPLLGLAGQFSHYLSRAMQNTALAAKAIGSESAFITLYRAEKDLFDDFGEIR